MTVEKYFVMMIFCMHLITHMDYLHYNPVKHGLVNNVVDWQHSSFHRLVKEGGYLADWGRGKVEFPDGFAMSLE